MSPSTRGRRGPENGGRPAVAAVHARRPTPLGALLAILLGVGSPDAVAAQRVQQEGVSGLIGCYALEIGAWSVPWDPGPLPARLELRETDASAPPPEDTARVDRGPSRTGRPRRALSTDDSGAVVPGFGRWVPDPPHGFSLMGESPSSVHVRLGRRSDGTLAGVLVPGRPDRAMDAARGGVLPRAPVVARPVPCDSEPGA